MLTICQGNLLGNAIGMIVTTVVHMTPLMLTLLSTLGRSDMGNLIEWSTETIRLFQETDPTIFRLLKIIPKGICPARPMVSLENREMRRFLTQWTELEVLGRSTL